MKRDPAFLAIGGIGYNTRVSEGKVVHDKAGRNKMEME